MEVKVPFTRYDQSIHYDTFRLTDWFCPSCGKKTVWEECSSGDYYAGPEVVCSSCGGTMKWPLRGEKVKRFDVLTKALESEVGDYPSPTDSIDKYIAEAEAEIAKERESNE